MIFYTPSGEAIRRLFKINAIVIKNEPLSMRRHANDISYERRDIRDLSIKISLLEMIGVTIFVSLRDQ